jgi:oligopeptide transport system substrate-binding protein
MPALHGLRRASVRPGAEFSSGIGRATADNGRMNTLRSVAAALVVVVSLLPGCGDPLPPAELTFISTNEHNELDPQKMSWSHDIRIAHALYETLVVLDFSDMTLHPGVAEGWEVSDDGLTYTFHLRDDARWSNGDPVVAEDFIYAWRRAMLPDLAADYTKLMYPIAGVRRFYDRRAEQLTEYAKIAAAGRGGSADAAGAMWQLTLDEFERTVGLSSPDEGTLVVRLERPTPYFLELVAFATFMPVHRASVERIAELDPSSGMLRLDSRFWGDPDRLVTNGPYVLKVRAFRRGLHLAQNPYYWNRANVRNRSINERIIGNAQTALQSYESGSAQMWLDVPTAGTLAADLAGQNRPDIHRQAMAGTYFYNFNCLPTLPNGQPNPLADVRVRRALALTINRETIVRNVTRLNQPVANSFIPVGALRDYQPPVEVGLGFEPDEARRLLAEAGFATPDNPQGRRLTGLSILYNTGHGHEYIAQAVAAMWREELGVVVTLDGVEAKVLGERMKSQDYTIARASWFGDYPDPTTWLVKMTSDDGNNDTRWSNAEYDALIEMAENEIDPARRNAIFREAETILIGEAPMALIYQWVSLSLIHPSVEGLRPNAWGRWMFEHASVATD